MEVIDKRSSSGYVKPEAPEINGKVAGFIPAFDRILIKRNPMVQSEGGIIRPEVAMEQASRGIVVAVGQSNNPLPPVGSISSFSKFAEEKHFDDEGSEDYVLVWNVDIRGWHNA
jgi:co-chaperonin GroES (HSP10)